MAEVTLEDVYYTVKLVQMGWTMKDGYWIHPNGYPKPSDIEHAQIYWDTFDYHWTFEEACNTIRK